MLEKEKEFVDKGSEIYQGKRRTPALLDVMNIFREFLRKLVSISDAEFAEASSHFRQLTLRKGDYFIKQDDICNEIGFVSSGTLKNCYVNEKGEEIISCFCGENNFTGSFKSFIQRKPSELAIQAIEATEIIAIDYENLNILYQKNQIWQTVGKIITENEYIVIERYASALSSLTAKERYLRLLSEHPKILQKASISEIASYLGITRRTLTRIRKEIVDIETNVLSRT